MSEPFECPEDHVHDGSTNCYNFHRCRCTPCRENKIEYNYWYRKMAPLGKVPPRTVDGSGTRRRIHALMRMGWTAEQLSVHIGGSKQSVLEIARKPLCRPATVVRVRAVYDQLWDQVPPGGRSAVTVRRAIARGWVPPMGWDDDSIDDPAAVPAVAESEPYLERCDMAVVDQVVNGARLRMTPRERREVVRRLYWLQWSDPRIAAFIGGAADQVRRIRVELDLPTFGQNALEDVA